MLNNSDIKIISKIEDIDSPLNNLDILVNKTVNTWQNDRNEEEKRSDTKLGKLAEDIIVFYINNNLQNIEYISYDTIRTNNYLKHAPFDGLLFKKQVDLSIVKSLINEINQEIASNDFGKLSDALKYKLLQSKIYIVEIKSTRITKRHYSSNTINLNSILNDDFLEYPKYTRIDVDNNINTLTDYINYARNHGLICSEDNCIEKIKKEEKSNMRHIYIRVYIDKQQNTAYIIGCITMWAFIENVVLKKMPQYNKSEYALYLSTNLRNGSNIDILNTIK